MRKFISTLAAITVMASGAAVLQLKVSVQEKTEEIRGLAQQIHDDKKAIRVLEAEWAYLSTPSALQDRSIEFLALMPPKARQVIHDPVVVPFRPRGVDVEEEKGRGVILPVAEKTEKKPPKREGDSL
jgi:hypothetical protein